MYLVSQIEFSKLFLSLRVVLILANSADPDEMQHYAAFHLGLHCQSTLIGVKCMYKGLMSEYMEKISSYGPRREKT